MSIHYEWMGEFTAMSSASSLFTSWRKITVNIIQLDARLTVAVGTLLKTRKNRSGFISSRKQKCS